MTYLPSFAIPKKFACLKKEQQQRQQKIAYLKKVGVALCEMNKKKCVTPSSFSTAGEISTGFISVTINTTHSSIFTMTGPIFTIYERRLLNEIWMLRNAINLNHYDQTVVRRGLKLTRKKIAMQTNRILEAELRGPLFDGMFRCRGTEPGYDYPVRDFVLTFIKSFVKNLKDLCDKELRNHITAHPNLELVEE